MPKTISHKETEIVTLIDVRAPKSRSGSRNTGSPEQERLILKVDNLVKCENLRCRDVDTYRERLTNMSDNQLTGVAEKLKQPKVLNPIDLAELENSEKIFSDAPTKENRKLRVDTIAKSLLAAKKERLEHFNEIKRELVKHGTPEQMEKFLKTALSEGIISKAQYDKIHSRLIKEGLKASGEEFNQYLYGLSVRVAQNLSTARTRAQESRAEARAANGTTSQAGQVNISLLSSISRQPELPKELISPFVRLFNQLNLGHSLNPETVEKILETIAEAVKHKAQETKDELRKQESESQHKELERVRDILARYPKLAGEIQLAFAELEKLPEYSIVALAKNLIKALHSNEAIH